MSDDLTLPLFWLAPGAPPLEVDFGCHRGAFLLGMATLYPSRNFLGIERQSTRVESCNVRIQRHGLANALAIRGESRDALCTTLPDACVSTLHISFPDPWPKRRHAKRRLITREFLAEVARVLRQNGSLRLMTDDADYFAEMRWLSSEGWREIPWADGVERATTTFEKTFRALGTRPFQLALEPVPACQPQQRSM